MVFDHDKLAEAGRRYMGRMDLEDMAALKISLLSLGALAGLGMKNKLVRRMAGVSCSILAAGLTIPLVSQFLDEYNSLPVVEAGPAAETGPAADADCEDSVFDEE